MIITYKRKTPLSDKLKTRKINKIQTLLKLKESFKTKLKSNKCLKIKEIMD